MEEETTPAPGAIEIRPTRAHAERDPENFYPLLEALRSPDTLPLRKIAEISGDNSLNPEPNILRKIKSRTLSGDARKVLLRHIFEDERLLTGRARRHLADIEHAPYFALLEYLNVAEEVQDNTRAHVVGTYKLWRYAVDHEHEFVLGKLTCFEDPLTRALRIDIQIRKNGREGLRSLCDQFSGYLFTVGSMFFTLVRVVPTNEVRMSFYPHIRMGQVGTALNPRSVFAGLQDHVVHMDGMMVGIDGKSVYHSPLHLSLVDDADELARLDEMLDVIPEDDARMPRRVLAKLKRHGPLKRL